VDAGDSGELRRFVVVTVALLLVCMSTYAFHLPHLGLLHDDWILVHLVAKGAPNVQVPDEVRPLFRVPFRLCGLLFGDALRGYYVALFALQWLGAILVYVIARLCGSGGGVAAAFAALAMMYPADASHFWLSTLALRAAWLLALIAILLAEFSARSDVFVSALAVGLASLTLYELHLFVLAGWPVVAWLLGRPWPRRRVMGWALVPIVYLTWRFVLRPIRGEAVIATADVLWDPLELARRAMVLVPYNLFLDGWLIGALEVIRSPLAVALFFMVLAAVTVPLAARWATGPAPRSRYFATAFALLVLGVAPIVPTTYWLGRTAGTFSGRILAAAAPGAALILLLGLAVVFRQPRLRALGFAALMALAFAFHWNVGRLAAENWAVQLRLTRHLQGQAQCWPPGSFLVILDLPPNKLAYDTPWGIGRLIQEACHDPTLAGIGISGERSPADILSVNGKALLIHRGAYGAFSLDRVITVRWRPDRLEPVPLSQLLEGL
jgi:hypothetical protein